MEIVSMRWVTRMREKALERVMVQGKAWFDWYSSGDTHAHTTQSVIQTLIKDGDDARAPISVVYEQTFVVFTILSTGLIWALILGWQLTLAGLAIAPIFAFVMVQPRFSSISEARNKSCREQMSKTYYEALNQSSLSVHLEGRGRKAYQGRFQGCVEGVRKAGVKGALWRGLGMVLRLG